MILGIGCDIIELRRIEHLLEEPKKIERIFTAEERRYCESRGRERIASFAGRFAAKEAVAKAFGCGIGIVLWSDIEIIKPENQAPTVCFYGEAARLVAVRRHSRMHVSMSHGKEYAVAQAVWEGEENG